MAILGEAPDYADWLLPTLNKQADVCSDRNMAITILEHKHELIRALPMSVASMRVTVLASAAGIRLIVMTVSLQLLW